MSERKVGIVAECVCDLPKSYLAEHNIDIVYFLIETDSGVFTDTDEITEENILSYMRSDGRKSLSSAPDPSTYKKFFETNLEKFDEIVFVTISSKISLSYRNAEKAIAEMGEDGKRIHLFDSAHLSTGLGLMIMRATELAENGSSVNEIISSLEELRDRVSTSFIVVNADYLYRSGKVSEKVKKLCGKLGIHPVLAMTDGKLAVKSVCFGDYEKASLRYIRRELKDSNQIDKSIAFLTSAGCSVKKLERIRKEINDRCHFDSLVQTKASATISSNCGPGTFGILFIRNNK